MRYDLIAIDLDGTLIGPDGEVSRANVAAIARAREAGVRVAVCTGRGLSECKKFLDRIAQDDPVAVAGGSIIACPRAGSTLHRFAMDHGMVRSAAERLVDRGHPVLVLKDPVAAGYEYLVVHGVDRHPIDPVTRWWFDTMRVRVRYAETLDEDEHPEHTVRFGVCGRDDELDRLHQDLQEVFRDRATMHSFPAVVAPEHTRSLAEGRRYHILEVFDRSANKWSAVRWIAARHGIEPERIAAIGDEVNDLSMIEGAGLGVAMGNATPGVRQAADRVTSSNAEDGVAHAVGQILQGAW